MKNISKLINVYLYNFAKKLTYATGCPFAQAGVMCYNTSKRQR